MHLNEIEELSELIAEKVYLKMTSAEILEKMSEIISNQVSKKLESSEKIDLSSLDMNVLASLAQDIQNKMEPDIVVKKLEL